MAGAPKRNVVLLVVALVAPLAANSSWAKGKVVLEGFGA